ncbi:hypothetical protein ACFWIP_22905, partial [Streptomyces anulatus]|uniref:hypothetical protein n=1 Tax=Streptomyces anulatus TaxID=1892 RepID=UPI0036672EEC
LRRGAEAMVTAADERVLALAQRTAQAAGPVGGRAPPHAAPPPAPRAGPPPPPRSREGGRLMRE